MPTSLSHFFIPGYLDAKESLASIRLSSQPYSEIQYVNYSQAHSNLSANKEKRFLASSTPFCLQSMLTIFSFNFPILPQKVLVSNV